MNQDSVYKLLIWEIFDVIEVIRTDRILRSGPDTESMKVPENCHPKGDKYIYEERTTLISGKKKKKRKMREGINISV